MKESHPLHCPGQVFGLPVPWTAQTPTLGPCSGLPSFLIHVAPSHMAELTLRGHGVSRTPLVTLGRRGCQIPLQRPIAVRVRKKFVPSKTPVETWWLMLPCQEVGPEEGIESLRGNDGEREEGAPHLSRQDHLPRTCCQEVSLPPPPPPPLFPHPSQWWHSCLSFPPCHFKGNGMKACAPSCCHTHRPPAPWTKRTSFLVNYPKYSQM